MVKAEKPLARKEPKPPVLWKPPKKGKGQKLQWEPGWDAPSYAAVAAGGRGKPNPPEVHEISSADEEEEEADSSADEAMGTEEEEDRQKAGTRGKWGRFRRQPQPSPPPPPPPPPPPQPRGGRFSSKWQCTESGRWAERQRLEGTEAAGESSVSGKIPGWGSWTQSAEPHLPPPPQEPMWANEQMQQMWEQMRAHGQHLENMVREQALEIARLRSGGDAGVGVGELADPPSTQEGWEPTASAAAGGEAEWDMPDLFEDDVWSPGREGYGPAGRKKKGGGAKPKKQASPYRDWRTAAVQ